MWVSGWAGAREKDLTLSDPKLIRIVEQDYLPGRAGYS